MPIASDDLRLFGLDLRTLWHEVRSPWRKLARAPGWSWLAPRTVVSVKSGDDGVSDWAPDAATHGFRKLVGMPAGADKKAATFEAVTLPEDLLLRKRLSMPRIGGDQIRQALQLEALNSTPFPSGDMVWGYAIRAGDANAENPLMDVELTLASRRRIEQFLASRSANEAATQAPEVWAYLSDQNERAMLLTGFGEDKREQATRRYWQILAALGVLALGLGIAIAVTPFLQLHSRVLQANQAYSLLDKGAAPAVAKREALVKADEQVKALGDIIGHRLDPLQVVQMLTNTLPDDTMLQRLQISDRKVLIAGQAADAASLMQKLGALPEVREVKAPSAAVRQPGMVKESFQIEFQLTDDFGVTPKDVKTAAALKGEGEAAKEAESPASAASAASAAASAASESASAPAGAASAAASAASGASAAQPSAAASTAGAQKTEKSDKKPGGGA